MSEAMSAEEPIKKAPSVCKEHDEQLKYYCETCDELVCIYCTVKTHNGHKHDSVKLMATKHRVELKKITADPVEGMMKSLSEARDSIEKIMMKIRRRGEEVDGKIDQHYDELVQELMKQKDEVKQQARDAVSKKENAMITQLEEVASMQAKLSSTKERTDALEQSSDQEALFAKKQVVKDVQQVTNAYKILNIQPVETAAMEFVPTKEAFPLFGHLFAYVNPHKSEVIDLTRCTIVGEKVEFAIVTRDSNGDRCVRGDVQVSIQLNTLGGNVGVGEVRDNKDGSYMASFVADQVGEVLVSVFINGEQIKGSPYSIAVSRNYRAIDKPDKIVSKIGNGSMSYPCGVAFGRNGLWAVVDWSYHCVYIFDDKDEFVRKIGDYGDKDGQFNHPHGVAFDSHDHLYVVDHNNARVQKFDTNGNYLLQFGSKKASKELKGAYGVVVHNDKVYVADYGNKQISVFYTNGEFYKTFDSAHLRGPMDVVVSANNNLLVLDCLNSGICTFTLDGQKFNTPGSGRGQLLHPYSLTTDLNGFILVADSGHHRVAIFEEDGNFLHCFGCHGSADSQFDTPRGIALSLFMLLILKTEGYKYFVIIN